MIAFSGVIFCTISDGSSEHDCINRKVIGGHLQDDEFDSTYLGERYRREAPLPQPKCNEWSAWINNNKPVNGTDEVEVLNQTQLDTLCPHRMGGNITKLRCLDDRGEPFEGAVNLTNVAQSFVATCNEPKDGATCHILKPGTNCPDYSLSFMCTCPTTSGSTSPTTPANNMKQSVLATKTTSSTNASTISTKQTVKSTTLSSTSAEPKTGTTQRSTTQSSTVSETKQTTTAHGTIGGPKNYADGNETNSLNGGGNSNNYTIGNSKVPWWLIPVIVGAILFIIIVIIAVCQHKKDRKQKIRPI